MGEWCRCGELDIEVPSGAEESGVSSSCSLRTKKAPEVKLPHGWSKATPLFDDERLVSCAGLVPVMGLAEQTGLAELIGDRVQFKASKVASAGVNPAGKLTAIIAGMVAGADQFLALRHSVVRARRR